MNSSNNHKPLFSLGQIVATPGALAALEQAGQAPEHFIKRHVGGDWGVVDVDDAEANNRALEDNSRLLSAYATATGTRIWVITEADRSSTCVLLPEEY